MDESSSDESNDDVVAPPAEGNVRQSVEEKVVTWSERKTNGTNLLPDQILELLEFLLFYFLYLQRGIPPTNRWSGNGRTSIIHSC